MQSTKLKKTKDFRGTVITAGIDTHLKQWNVSIYVGTRFHKTFQQPAEALVLYNYLQKNFPGGTYQSGYEAGYFGYTPHRTLIKLGIKNKVLNARDIPSSAKDKKRKNDKKDSKKIALNLIGHEDQIPELYVLSSEAEADRQLIRYRSEALRKELTRTRQRLKSFLVLKGKHKEISDYTTARWSYKKLKELEGLEFENQVDQQVLMNLLEDYKAVKKKHSRVDRQIVKLSEQVRYQALIKRLRTIPGVGILVGMTIITEIVDMARFDCFDKLCSFAGIVPDLRASDEVERVGKITKRANKYIRRMLVQSSWIASGRDPFFSKIYHQQNLKNGQCSQKSIIKVGNKMLSIIRALWMKETEYIPDYNKAK